MLGKGVNREFQEQFGRQWRCTCKAQFRPESLEILSESENSLLAHYQCPKCGREQMLAAAISEEETNEQTSEKLIKLPKTTVTTDDVLDIKAMVSKMKLASIKALGRERQKRSSITISRITSPKS